MHEISIAVELVDQIIEIAVCNNMVCIEKVEIETGVLREIIPDIMQTAFESISEDTILKGAELKITQIKTEAKCRQCNEIFQPKTNDFRCPSCGKADATILKGNEIILKSVIGHAEENKKRGSDL